MVEPGVPGPDPAGDCARPDDVLEDAWDGDEVPELESFFFDALFESFARESCSCCEC